MRNRPHPILLYLNDREKAALDRKCAAAHLSRAAFLRACILEMSIRAPPEADYARLYREVNAIGHNVNQIARAANGRVATSQDITHLMGQLADIYTVLEGGLRPSP